MSIKSQEDQTPSLQTAACVPFCAGQYQSCLSLTSAGIEHILQVTCPGKGTDGLLLPGASATAYNVGRSLGQSIHEGSQHVQMALSCTSNNCTDLPEETEHPSHT